MKYLLYAAMLGSGLWILTEFMELYSETGTTSLSLWLTTIWHPILAIGFWGLHKSQSPGRNPLSLIGALFIILAFLAFAPVSIMILNSPIDTFSAFLEQHPEFMAFGLVSLAGNILFSIAMIRSGFYPRWMGYGFILMVLAGLVQSLAGLPEWIQHVSFVLYALIIIAMAAFGLRNRSGKALFM